jgi:hypothetical protein
MTPSADTARYKNHRFPGEIISHGVWLYYRWHCQVIAKDYTSVQ